MNAFADRRARVVVDAGRQRTAGAQRHGRHQSSAPLAHRWAAMGCILADVAPSNGVPPRLAHLNVSFGLTAHPRAPWAARFWETDTPPGVQPIDWLFTSRSSLSCLEDALELLDNTQGLVTSYAVD